MTARILGFRSWWSRGGGDSRRGAARTSILIACLALLTLASPAGALIGLGQQAPDFTKSVLGGGTASISDYSGKVVVLFLLGYD